MSLAAERDAGVMAHAPSASTHRLLREFAAAAGGKGLKTLAWVVAGAVLEAAGIWLLAPLLGVLSGAGVSAGWASRVADRLFAALGAETVLSRLAALAGVFLLVMVLRTAVLTGRDILIAELQFRFIERQRRRIVARLVEARWDAVARLRHARVIQVMGGDVQRLSIGINFILLSAVAMAMLAAQCLVALSLAPVPAALMLSVLLAGSFAFRPMLARARLAGGQVAQANLNLLDSTAQFLGGLKLAISQDLQAGFVRQVTRTMTDLFEEQVGHAKQHARARLIVTALLALAAAMLVIAGYGWLHASPAAMMTLLLVLARMMQPVAQVQQGLQQFAHTQSVFEKIQALDDELTAARAETPGAARLPEGEIVFDRVSFRHAGSDARIAGCRDVSLSIAPGEFLAVTGRSGAGKTTFADLLAGLYPPQCGRITVGGELLRDANLAAWRSRLSYVSQDPFLFHDTIRHNLAWASPNASEAEMWRVLGIACADRLVRELGEGLDSIAGERGSLLSGGERQRLALARALLRRPGLLILDEALSALDDGSERAILMRLAALESRPTIVLISHRSTNLDVCDRVLALG
jgi:ATP-binding cassette subfamily C protein